MMYRLPHVAGESIDRNRPLAFTFEGTPYQGFAGDTITSALAAAGVMVLGRSFKYHRPRGILSYANHDVNALFQIGGVPNVRGDVVELEAGMDIHAVNTFGGLARDSGSWMDRCARFLPVGFYYKAFHSKLLFPMWENLIRHFSGLGKIALDAERIRTPKRYAFCDVLVVGGGISGLSAALAAAESGAKVLLVDEGARLHSGFLLVGDTARITLLLSQVASHPNIEVLSATVAVGYYADHWIALMEPQRMTKVRAQCVVFATGVIEQPAVFRNNDTPGVLMISAAIRLLRRHAIAAGRHIVIQARASEDYAAALELVRHGVAVSHIIDVKSQTADYELIRRLKERGILLLTGRAVTEAHADSKGCLRRVTIAKAGTPHENVQSIDCDTLLMTGGWAAASQLLLQAGGTVRFDNTSQMYLPDVLPSGIFTAGRVNGIFDAKDRAADGQRAGHAAAAYLGMATMGAVTALARVKQPPSQIVAHPRGKDFIDFDEDLQVRDLEHAAQEGFDSIELLKRYTTVGMGPSQGKHSHINAARVLSRIRGSSPDQIGLTTARPMYHPVPMKHLAGRGFSPERATPLATRHEELGAVWMLAGNWRRPEYYARSNETREQSIAGEVAAVRQAVGIIDIGTLGKLEVHGPDAGKFLDRVYSGRYSDLRVGMTRYALMLDEAGTIVDDGVVARTGAESYYFTATTGGSAAVYRELLRLNALWGMQCSLTNVTGHRAAFNLAGPRSRELLASLAPLDLSNESFPYLGFRETTLAGVPVRIMRVGFVGELGYEIHVAFSQALAVWDAISAEGVALGLRPFGVEAQRVLRLEKGHFIIGQDTDGLTQPFEARADWAVRMNKEFFVGQRSLRILQKRGPRQLLVGFEIATAVPGLQESHLAIDAGEIAGRITSIAYSQVLGKTIGLAMVKPALAQVGTTLTFRQGDGTMVAATVCETPFYDKAGDRQKSTAIAASDAPTLALPRGPGEGMLVGAASPISPASPTSSIPSPGLRGRARVGAGAGAGATSPVVADLGNGGAGAFLEDRQQRKRIGLKGPLAAEWLQQCGISIPERANSWTAITASENDVVMRLGATEFFFEQSVYAEEFTTLANALASPVPGVYPVLREDRAFVLGGSLADAVLAQVCNVNFRSLALIERHAVMTMMTGVAVTVVPQGNVAQRRYLIWCDPSFGDYLWSSLSDVVADITNTGGSS
jgi:sarcosine oxidase subunit alpha